LYLAGPVRLRSSLPSENLHTKLAAAHAEQGPSSGVSHCQRSASTTALRKTYLGFPRPASVTCPAPSPPLERSSRPHWSPNGSNLRQQHQRLVTRPRRRKRGFGRRPLGIKVYGSGSPARRGRHRRRSLRGAIMHPRLHLRRLLQELLLFRGCNAWRLRRGGMSLRQILPFRFTAHRRAGSSTSFSVCPRAVILPRSGSRE
jgi:hypothetical protein